MVADMFRDREELPQTHKTYHPTEEEALRNAKVLERGGYRIILGIKNTRCYYSRNSKPLPWIVQYTEDVRRNERI